MKNQDFKIIETPGHTRGDYDRVEDQMRELATKGWSFKGITHAQRPAGGVFVFVMEKELPDMKPKVSPEKKKLPQLNSKRKRLEVVED